MKAPASASVLGLDGYIFHFSWKRDLDFRLKRGILLWKRELFDWTTGGEQTPFPANKHHSYARVPFIIFFMTFCAFEGMDGVNTNEVCTDLLNVLQKKRLVTQAQHDCFQWGGDFASKLNLPRRRDALLSDDEKHGGSESRESRRFF